MADTIVEFFAADPAIRQVLNDHAMTDHGPAIAREFEELRTAGRTDLSEGEARALVSRISAATGADSERVVNVLRALRDAMEAEKGILAVPGALIVVAPDAARAKIVITGAHIAGAFTAIVAVALYRYAASRGFGYGGSGWRGLRDQLGQYLKSAPEQLEDGGLPVFSIVPVMRDAGR